MSSDVEVRSRTAGVAPLRQELIGDQVPGCAEYERGGPLPGTEGR